MGQVRAHRIIGHQYGRGTCWRAVPQHGVTETGRRLARTTDGSRRHFKLLNSLLLINIAWIGAWKHFVSVFVCVSFSLYLSFCKSWSQSWAFRKYILQYIQGNFQFCPTCLKTLCCDETVSPEVGWKRKWCDDGVGEKDALIICEWINTYMPNGSGKKQCFEIIAQKISAKNMNNDLVFFRDEIKIF